MFEDLSAAESAVKGFVQIKEEESDVSESQSDEDSDDDSESGKPPKSKPKKVKLRKWWVNKIKGRPLRMEFAEDAQVRYKKRYGKDGTKAAASDSAGAAAEEPKSGPVVVKTVVEYRKEYAPRLTGGIVESKGRKITF